MTIRVNKVQLFSKRLILLGCIALMAGGLSVFTQTSASADLVYVPVTDTITAGQSMRYNLDSAGGDDVVVSNDSTNIGTISLIAVSGVVETGVEETDSPPATAFLAGTTIDAGSFISPSPDSYLYNLGVSNFLNPTQPVYVGFSFASGFGAVNAWADISLVTLVNGQTVNVQINGFAFQNNGGPIAAGAIPEPSGLVLLAFATAYVVSPRRRNA